MRYANHILLILAGIFMMMLRVINYIYLQGLHFADVHNLDIVSGTVGVEEVTAWTYTPLPQIIGLLLIASGVLGIVKEMKAND